MTLTMTSARAAGWMLLLLVLLLSGPLLTLALGRVPLHGDWSTATHRSAGLAPDPAIHHEAVVQIYASRTFGWRGAFAVHTWLAAKPADAERYTRYEVIGWNARGGRSAVSISDRNAPDAEWYGAAPTLIKDLRGANAEAVVAKLTKAAADYPYGKSYSAWPGPNSNTFIAYLGRAVPELRLDLPATAIGKDFIPGGLPAAMAPSGTGVQVSLFGLLGVMAGAEEGLELNVLSLTFGVDVKRPALKLPIVGRGRRSLAEAEPAHDR